MAMILLAALAVVGGVGEYVAVPAERVWLADAGWVSGALAAVIGVEHAMLRSAGRERAGWAMLLAGCFLNLAADLLWAVGGATEIPAQACWLAFAVMGSAGIHRLGLGAKGSRRVSWVEIAPLIAAVCALMTGLLWSEAQASPAPALEVFVAFAAPVFYGSAVLVMLQSVLCGALDVRRNPGMAAVLGGVFLQAIAFILWCPALLAQTYTVGTNAADALWTLGILLVAGGARTARPPGAIADASELSRRRGGILPALAFVTLLGIAAVFVAAGEPAGPTLALIAGVLIAGAVGITRTTLLGREQARLLARLSDRERELQDANRRLSEESRRDPLTGLGNRLRLREDFAELAARAGRYGNGYCIVLFDLDRFKDYNDIVGHQAGDGALRQVAEQLRDHTRAGDRVYRYG
ncbi:MAG: diguanylate cyclase domain, partial [Acidimicrobiales bacterium]|nr:diguanylate cyclase domain [Acidimicrobiales bacterium]